MAQEVKYLSYSGLSHFKNKLDSKYLHKQEFTIGANKYAKITGGGIFTAFISVGSTFGTARHMSCWSSYGSGQSIRTNIKHIINGTDIYIDESGTGPIIYIKGYPQQTTIHILCSLSSFTCEELSSLPANVSTTNTNSNNYILAVKSDIPTKVSQLTNDAGYTTATGHTHSYLPLGGGTMTGTINSRSIIPTATNTYDLGSSGYKWNYIYSNKSVANSFIENGEYLSDKYANKAYADYCSSYLHSPNRAQFCKPAGVTLEYSTDSGSTWVDYGATDEQKIGFFSGISQDFYLGKKLSTKALASDMLRLTMDATAMGFYTSCKSLLINISTNGSSNFRVKVEKSMKGSVDTFSTLIESQTLTGWSGWNRIPIGYSFGGGATQIYNVAKLRLTFMSDGANSSYTSGAHPQIADMEVLGDTYWGVPHTMAKTGHIYSWDYLGNAIFSKNVTADKFIGNLTGNASSATLLSTPTDSVRDLNEVLDEGTRAHCYHADKGSTNGPVRYGGVLNVHSLYSNWQLFASSSTSLYFRQKWSISNVSDWKKLAFADGTGATGTWPISITGNAASASKLSNKLTLTVGTNSAVEYDGSATKSVSITAESLGLSKVFDYKGVTTTTLTDGSTTKPIVISNVSYTQKVGDVVIVNGDTDKEYFWNGSKWEEMGRTIDLSGYSPTSHTHSNASTSTAGFMSAADKSKLDGIATGANKYTHPSTHAASMITGLSTVATSGSYNDLSNKPTSLKNPYSLTIVGNNTRIASYDGSSTVTATITAASIGAAASSHNHTYLKGAGIQASATTRNLTNFPATTTLFTGGWTASGGTYATNYGTTLDISYSTWYQRLAFNTSGRIEYFRGINSDNSDKTSATLGKIGDLAYTSDIPTKVSQLTNDAGYTTATGHTHSYLPLGGGTMTGTINSQSIIPKTTNTYDLGSSSLKWKNIYATTFTGNLTGNVTGSATKLGSTTISFTPAETDLTPDNIYTLVGGTTIKRGSWYYAGNGYISNDTTGVGTIDLAGTTVIQADSDSTAYTQLYLTPATGSTTGCKTNEIFMYNNNGSGYNPSWTRVLTNRNYAEYALPLSGGALTGPITFNLTDADRNIIRINNGTGDATTTSNYGFTLKYLGSGSGDNNSLALFSDNSTATAQNKSFEIKQSGNIHTRNIIPLSNNTYSLGNSSYKWSNVYATTFTGNLKGSMLSSVSNSSSASITEIPNAIRFDSFLASNTTSGFGSGYNNAILTVGRFETTNYASQLGFSGNGKIYYRSFVGEPLDDSKTWSQIALTSDIPTSLTNTEIDDMFKDEFGITF